MKRIIPTLIICAAAFLIGDIEGEMKIFLAGAVIGSVLMGFFLMIILITPSSYEDEEEPKQEKNVRLEEWMKKHGK